MLSISIYSLLSICFIWPGLSGWYPGRYPLPPGRLNNSLHHDRVDHHHHHYDHHDHGATHRRPLLHSLWPQRRACRFYASWEKVRGETQSKGLQGTVAKVDKMVLPSPSIRVVIFISLFSFHSLVFTLSGFSLRNIHFPIFQGNINARQTFLLKLKLSSQHLFQNWFNLELWHRSSSNIWNPNRLKCFSNDLPFEPERIIFCMKIERIFIIRLKVANNGMCVRTSGSVHTCQRLVLWVTNQPPHANSNLINLIQLNPL